MKISWLILTYNRPETVRRAMRWNMANAGAECDEIVWVDNGSESIWDIGPPMTLSDVVIQHNENLGVAKGYNRAMALSTGTHMVITGCDRLMPDNWLKIFKTEFEKDPALDAACMWEKPYSERFYRGLPLPMGARMFSRRILKLAGYLREDFGLYGWEDVEWAHRVCHATLKIKLLPQMPRHFGSEGIEAYNGMDPPEYHAFKAKEARDPKKKELFERCRREGFPYYSPY